MLYGTRHISIFRLFVPLIATAAALLLSTVVALCTADYFNISRATLKKAEEQYGPSAKQRLLAWQELIRTGQKDTDQDKLEKVNRFINTMAFIDDAIHWGEKDYWATPAEFLASAGGDCEDFAIAKYFTLLSLQIPERKLTLTYVKSLRLHRAHMVLTYYATAEAEPLVLDNLTNRIRPSSQRTDLIPVYSLNGTGLWLAKIHGKGQLVGDSSRLQRWQDLITRMTDELSTAVDDIP